MSTTMSSMGGTRLEGPRPLRSSATSSVRHHSHPYPFPGAPDAYWAPLQGWNKVSTSRSVPERLVAGEASERVLVAGPLQPGP